jgi:hypothetical protein
LAELGASPLSIAGNAPPSCNHGFTNLQQASPAGIYAADRGNTNAAERSYSALAALCL